MLAAAVADKPFPWQVDAIGDICSRDHADVPSYSTIGLTVPRQNGKNKILEVVEFYLVVNGYHILHTAHRVKTAKKSFERLARYFKSDSHPEIQALVDKIRYTNGEEAVFLGNGGSIEFSARSRAGNRGFDDIQAVVFDEAQDLTDEQLEAIMYTLSASRTGDRQLIYTGTSPDSGSPGTVFRRLRESCLGPMPPDRTLWLEWGAEGMPKPDSTFDDVIDLVYETNPSMGYLLDIDFTRTEFANGSIDGFARERLGWWCGTAGEAVIPAGVWDSSSVAEPVREGKKTFAVKFSPDGSSVALAACREPKVGPAHVELIGVHPLDDGFGWMCDLLLGEGCISTTAAVAVDGRNGADALVDRLKCGYPRHAIMLPGTRGVVASSTMLLSALRDGDLTHWGNPGQAALDRSALSSVRRPVGHDGGWSFGGDDSTAIEAAALAYWASRNTKRDPTRKARVHV